MNIDTFTIEEDGGVGMLYARHHGPTGSFYGISIDPESERPPAWFQFPEERDGSPALTGFAEIDEDQVPRDTWRALRDDADAWGEPYTGGTGADVIDALVDVRELLLDRMEGESPYPSGWAEEEQEAVLERADDALRAAAGVHWWKSFGKLET